MSLGRTYDCNDIDLQNVMLTFKLVLSLLMSSNAFWPPLQLEVNEIYIHKKAKAFRPKWQNGNTSDPRSLHDRRV